MYESLTSIVRAIASIDSIVIALYSFSLSTAFLIRRLIKNILIPAIAKSEIITIITQNIGYSINFFGLTNETYISLLLLPYSSITYAWNL